MEIAKSVQSEPWKCGLVCKKEKKYPALRVYERRMKTLYLPREVKGVCWSKKGQDKSCKVKNSR